MLNNTSIGQKKDSFNMISFNRIMQLYDMLKPEIKPDVDLISKCKIMDMCLPQEQTVIMQPNLLTILANDSINIKNTCIIIASGDALLTSRYLTEETLKIIKGLEDKNIEFVFRAYVSLNLQYSNKSILGNDSLYIIPTYNILCTKLVALT